MALVGVAEGHWSLVQRVDPTAAEPNAAAYAAARAAYDGGQAAIVVAHQTMQRDGAALRLVARLESQPVRVLRITGLYSHLPVYFTLGAAVNDAQGTIAEAR